MPASEEENRDTQVAWTEAAEDPGQRLEVPTPEPEQEGKLWSITLTDLAIILCNLCCINICALSC